jgi:nondiscriminating aspartyl-tRNA synthetase
MSSYQYCDIRQLTSEETGQKIWIQGRVDTIRDKGRICFLRMRYQDHYLQALALKKHLKDKLNPLARVNPESVINLYGELKESPQEIETATYKHIEFVIEDWELASPAQELPFLINDAGDFGEVRSDVDQSLKHDYRYLDLRVPVNLAIMKIQSGVGQLFREFMCNNGFTELHSPKLIGAASEGGAEVFKLKYFGKDAFLAQSPQLYKQMAINSDMDRVFEVAPVFRAENSMTSRHLTEFVGLDLEMAISPDRDYHEVLETMWGLLTYILDGLAKRYDEQISTIKEKLPFETPRYTYKPLIITFKEGVEMLNEAGFEQDPYEDLNRANEKALGDLIKEKHCVDLFILDQYPLSARPFYTMPHPDDPKYSCSYDVIFRGQEISSGAQRIHDYEQLMEQVKAHGVNPETLSSYLDSFKYGSKAHGGCGFGLERIVSFYLDLGNVKRASFCYRDPKRLSP